MIKMANFIKNSRKKSSSNQNGKILTKKYIDRIPAAQDMK